ncbi:MAG: hypothetical protein QOG15_1025 [Solirubrobacteraceae bacterium]|nr:hypothetical protein [Solirubrobacteraceae bacterium]
MNEDDVAEHAGLAHVATASFIASRVVPTGGFAVALAGGVAIARVGERSGARVGYGASLAAMLQAVAVMGPLRIGIPLTQALSAPLLGRLHARGATPAASFAACAVIRLLDQIVVTAFYIWIVAGGLDAYATTYDALTSKIPGLPSGTSAALVATGIGLLVWTVFASVVQVLVYRSALVAWPRAGAESAARATAGATEVPASVAPPGLAVAEPAHRRRYDPRLVAAAASVAFVVLLVTTAWAALAAVAGWLAVAWATARGDREPVRAGLALGALLAVGALVFGLVGGSGLELTLQRTARVVLLVLVATWLRCAAGEEGLREVFRRVLRRVHGVAPMAEASAILDRLGATGALAASSRALVETVRHVPRRPQPLAAAVLGWIATEAARFERPRSAREEPSAVSSRARVVP